MKIASLRRRSSQHPPFGNNIPSRLPQSSSLLFFFFHLLSSLHLSVSNFISASCFGLYMPPFSPSLDSENLRMDFFIVWFGTAYNPDLQSIQILDHSHVCYILLNTPYHLPVLELMNIANNSLLLFILHYEICLSFRVSKLWMIEMNKISCIIPIFYINI